MPIGIWRSPNQQNPDFGSPHRFRTDPAARDIIRQYKQNGFINAVGMGEFGAVRATEAECAVHDGVSQYARTCTCPVWEDDDE